MTFGVEKLEWCGYPVVKNSEYIFIHVDRIHERDEQTDRRMYGQTPRDGIDRACIESRGKNG